MSDIGEVRKALVARRDDEIQKNGAGTASDWPDYCRRKGKVQGLETAIAVIDETRRKLQQRDGGVDSDSDAD